MYGISEDIMHTGVKGMRWGVRKTPTTSKSDRSSRWRARAQTEAGQQQNEYNAVAARNLTRANNATVRRLVAPVSAVGVGAVLASIGGVSIAAIPIGAVYGAVLINRALKVHGNKKLIKMYQD